MSKRGVKKKKVIDILDIAYVDRSSTKKSDERQVQYLVILEGATTEDAVWVNKEELPNKCDIWNPSFKINSGTEKAPVDWSKCNVKMKIDRSVQYSCGGAGCKEIFYTEKELRYHHRKCELYSPTEENTKSYGKMKIVTLENEKEKPPPTKPKFEKLKAPNVKPKGGKNKNKVNNKKLEVVAEIEAGLAKGECFICKDGGDLLICDYCSKDFHIECLNPPLASVPFGKWKCDYCNLTVYIPKEDVVEIPESPEPIKATKPLGESVTSKRKREETERLGKRKKYTSLKNWSHF